MICPRCGRENPENSVNCQSCGLKIGTICPRCRTLNKIGQVKCVKCNLTLIRFCPKCSAPNFPNVTNCRKCGAEILRKVAKKPAPPQEAPSDTVQNKLLQPAPPPNEEKLPEIQEYVRQEPVSKQADIRSEIEQAESEQVAKQESQTAPVQEQQPEAEHQQVEQELPQESAKKEFTRSDASNFIQQVITRSNKGFLLDVAGADGIGKSTIISNLAKNVTDRKFIWLVGQAEPNHSKIPYSFFRDMLRSLFNVPMLIENREELKKNLAKAFEITLEITDKKVINTACRILLNEFDNVNSNIEDNGFEVRDTIERIIAGLASKSSIAMVAEDFDYIDKASFDCIKHLLKKGFLEGPNFLFINHTNATNFSKFFPEEIASNKYLMVVIKPLEIEELNSILLNMVNGQDILPDDVKQKIFENSKGLPVFIEQVLWFMFQTGVLFTEQQGNSHVIKFNPRMIDIEVPSDLAELLSRRFDIFDKSLPFADKILFTAATFGHKFSPVIVQRTLGIDDQKSNETFQLLVNSGVFSMIDNRTLAFKHISLWKLASTQKIEFDEAHKIYSNLLTALEIYPEVSDAYRALLADNTGDVEKAVYFSHKASDEAFALGDIHSYTESQLKVYKLLGSVSMPENEREAARLSIIEQVGKVNYISNPQIAIKYLTESMKKYEEDADENIVKLIELNGYLSESYNAVGNYLGVLECAEKAIALTDADEDSLEIMLINFSKLDAVFNLGRLEEVVMSAKNEILPRVARAISRKETLSGMSLNEMKDVEFRTELILAKALIFQGHKESIDILDKVLAKVRKVNNAKYELSAMLLQALFATIQGNLKECEEIHKSIESKNLMPHEPDEAKLQWLFISLLTNLSVGNFEQARTICYSVLSLAKEIRNFNTFSIVKLLSGFFYQHFQYYRNATTIYEEIANYCSENKMATGALYSWYLSAEAELQTGNPERALEIGENALDIAHKPNIHNQLAAGLLSRLLAEAKITLGDIEGAQINIENAMNIAEKNDLYLLMIYSCLTLGKLYQEKSSTIGDDGKEMQCNNAYRCYIKALGIAEKNDNRFFISKIERILSNLAAFCKLSGINLEK